jgi:hypothetical protein
VFRVVELVVLVLAVLFLVPVIFWPFVEGFIDPVLARLAGWLVSERRWYRAPVLEDGWMHGRGAWDLPRRLVREFYVIADAFEVGLQAISVVFLAILVAPSPLVRQLLRAGWFGSSGVPVAEPVWARFTVETPGLTGWTDWIGFELELEFELGLRKRPVAARRCCDMPLSQDGRCPRCGRFTLVAEPVKVAQESPEPWWVPISGTIFGLLDRGASTGTVLATAAAAHGVSEVVALAALDVARGRAGSSAVCPGVRLVEDTVAATDSIVRAAQAFPLPPMDIIRE